MPVDYIKQYLKDKKEEEERRREKEKQRKNQKYEFKYDYNGRPLGYQLKKEYQDT